MNWTDERVEILKKLWADGLSCSQIAAKLGGVSRNAVIGKVRRLKLSSRGRAHAKSPRTKKPPAPKGVKPSGRTGASYYNPVIPPALKEAFDMAPVPERQQVTIRPVESVVVPISRRLKLDQINERTCKWPNGDPLAEDFHFCGNDSAETGPYCNYHARIAFLPVSERRRSR